MKLRNKKTGEVVDVESLGHAASLKEKYGYQVTLSWKTEYENISQCKDYHSLAELNEEWEDVPAESLIKDEKIRKAVRAWAEADDLDNFRVQNQHFNDCKIIGYTAGINKASFISFQATIAHSDNEKLYTITELCGEETIKDEG